MVKSWREDLLLEENRDLRNRLRACLELIEDLSNLDEPLFKAKLDREFKLKYARTVSRAKKSLAKKVPS
jgi:hypothetical protein